MGAKMSQTTALLRKTSSSEEEGEGKCVVLSLAGEKKKKGKENQIKSSQLSESVFFFCFGLSSPS
jgi:hypothetical protein